MKTVPKYSGAAAALAGLAAGGMRPRLPRVREPRQQDVKFTADDLAELRKLAPREKRKAVKELKAKYRAGKREQNQ